MKPAHAAYHQQQSINDWLTIGVIHSRKVVKYSCDHRGTLGTPDQSLCASCQLTKKHKEREELGL